MDCEFKLGSGMYNCNDNYNTKYDRFIWILKYNFEISVGYNNDVIHKLAVYTIRAGGIFVRSLKEYIAKQTDAAEFDEFSASFAKLDLKNIDRMHNELKNKIQQKLKQNVSNASSNTRLADCNKMINDSDDLFQLCNTIEYIVQLISGSKNIIDELELYVPIGNTVTEKMKQIINDYDYFDSELCILSQRLQFIENLCLSINGHNDNDHIKLSEKITGLVKLLVEKEKAQNIEKGT